MSVPGLRGFHRPQLWLLGWIVTLKLALIVCLVPLPGAAVPVPHVDKLEHVLGFALLTAYAAMLFERRRDHILAALGLCAYGALIEVLQALVPWRSADALDLAADVLGVILGLSIAWTPLARLMLRVDRVLAPHG